MEVHREARNSKVEQAVSADSQILLWLEAALPVKQLSRD